MVTRSQSLALLLLAAVVAAASAASPSDNNGGFDHRAHAVPGGPYQIPDHDSDGSATVKLNGELSHSHYFNPSTGATGKVVKYFWSVGNKVVCKAMICNLKFPRGTTRVELRVVDNTGDSATASTTVNVYEGAKPKLRYWFYPGRGWIADNVNAGQPKYSMTEPVLNMHSPGMFPAFLKRRFSMRVLGNINTYKQGNYRFRLKCIGGSCTMWIGRTMVLVGKDKEIISKPMMFSRGNKKLHVVYRRPNANAPKPRLVLSWQVPGRKGWSVIPRRYFSHNPAALKPVVRSVHPGRAEVGSVITVVGSSFINVKSVQIGKHNCAGPTGKNQFSVRCVVPGITGTYQVFVRTTRGVSNSMPLTITVGSFGSKFGSEGNGVGPVGYFQPVRFRNDFLKRNGKVFNIPQLTAITLGPDNQYYIGSLGGFVHVVKTDLSNNVKGYCKSEKVGKSRSVLGVAFNPAENRQIRLYASTSVLYWGTKKLLPFTRGWHNGEVIAMQKTKKSCLSRVKTVVSGLPVSNYDHSVNGISFDMGGNLLISIGGGTNAGVSKKGDPLGGVPDSPLSGAILWAPVLKKNFNGRVAYNQYFDPGRANKVRGDVHVHSAGLRNSFCNVAHSNGHIYATDNGANAKFGARSTGCRSEGGIATEPDTLKKLKRGGFFGYSNRNRGRYDKRQCRHRSPHLNEGGYDKPIARMESSTTGLLEYTANTFGAQLRGDLLATKFAVSGNGKVYRIQLKRDGTVKSMFNLAFHSGLSAAMSPAGGLVMPRVYQGKIAVLIAKEKNPGRMVVTSVNPFRGPKRGGGRITITGWNLTPPLTITVGGKACKNVGEYRGGRSVSCTVPRGSGRAAVVVKRFGKQSKSFGYEYVYMNV